MTSVISCLSSGLAKTINYVHVCPIFRACLAILKVWLFLENGCKNRTVEQDVFSQFFKGTTIQ